MPDFYIPLQEHEHRDGKTWHVVPMWLPDDSASLAQLPDGEYHLLKVKVDEDNKIQSASVVRKRKKVKTPTVQSKVTEV